MADLSTLLGMIDIQTISIVSAAIGILIGVFNWIRKSSTAERQRQTEIETRQAQLFMQIYDHFNETEFSTQYVKILFHWEWKDFEDWWQKYGPEANVEENASFASAARYYEGVGVLVKKGLIDIDLVGELMSSYIIRFWEPNEHVIKGMRERLNWPEVFQGFEYLYNELKKYEEQHPELKT